MCKLALWAGEDSNLRSRKTADLQSAPFGHSGTCPELNARTIDPFQNLSHWTESNQRPTDYKSVALPAELKWQFDYLLIDLLRPDSATHVSILWNTNTVKSNHNYKLQPLIFGKAKVREFDKYKNFERNFFHHVLSAD